MDFPLRYLAPAGAPLTAADLVRWCGTAFAGMPASLALQKAIRERFGVRHVSLTSTGRGGLTVLLRAMSRLAGRDRDEVIVPAYTCYSVPASVVKAGLRPRIVDISPDTLDYSAEALGQTDFSRVLAVVATNLYGLPNDLPALDRLTRRHKVFLIDDAAQALGATVGGRLSGTWGDAGLFSFDKGKNISAIDGGILLTSSDELAAAIDAEMEGIESPGAGASAIHVLKAIAYFALLRPWLYGIPARIPQLGLGKTIYTTDFPLAQTDSVLAALGLTMLRRLDQFTATRRANAAALLEALQGSGVVTVTPQADSVPAYLRLPILMRNEQDQRAVIAALRQAGIGATGSYPESIADVPELRDSLANSSRLNADGGRTVARRIVTLPTHPFVRPSDIRRLVEVLDHSIQWAPQRELPV